MAIIVGAAVHVLTSLEQLTKVVCGIVHLVLLLDSFQVRLHCFDILLVAWIDVSDVCLRYQLSKVQVDTKI